MSGKRKQSRETRRLSRLDTRARDIQIPFKYWFNIHCPAVIPLHNDSSFSWLFYHTFTSPTGVLKLITILCPVEKLPIPPTTDDAIS